VYGTVRTVVWEDGEGDLASYPINLGMPAEKVGNISGPGALPSPVPLAPKWPRRCSNPLHIRVLLIE